MKFICGHLRLLNELILCLMPPNKATNPISDEGLWMISMELAALTVLDACTVCFKS
jgi:hypothetical protein